MDKPKARWYFRAGHHLPWHDADRHFTVDNYVKMLMDKQTDPGEILVISQDEVMRYSILEGGIPFFMHYKRW